MSDEKKFVPGKYTSHPSMTIKVEGQLPMGGELFNSPNEFLHHLADLTGLEDLKRRANVGEGAWISNVTTSTVEVGAITETPVKPRVGPPDAVIRAACMAAVRSPCQKSKRGAIVFHPFTGWACVSSWNGRPDNKCDEMCFKSSWGVQARGMPSACSALCIHAEARAVRFALHAEARSEFVADGDYAFSIRDCELVHAKVENSELVASGPPSCWQCAKEMAEVGLVGVWLYEADFINVADDRDAMFPEIRKVQSGRAQWNFYPMREFYDRTLKECGLVR